MATLTNEKQVGQELIKKEAKKLYSLLREQIGKLEAGWKEKAVKEELITTFKNITKSNESNGEIFEMLRELSNGDEKELEYINTLAREAVTNLLNNAVTDPKKHFNFSGAEVVDAIIVKENLGNLRAITLEKWREISKKYFLNKEDIMSFVLERVLGREEDKVGILENAGITEKDYNIYLEAQKGETKSTEEEKGSATTEQEKEKERLAELQKLITEGQVKLKELSQELMRIAGMPKENLEAIKNALKNLAQNARLKGKELEKYYMENKQYSSIAKQRERVLSIHNQLADIYTEARANFKSLK